MEIKKIETTVTDFEKAVYIAATLRGISGVRRLSPEEILGKCQTPEELDRYYNGLRTR